VRSLLAVITHARSYAVSSKMVASNNAWSRLRKSEKRPYLFQPDSPDAFLSWCEARWNLKIEMENGGWACALGR
jgi:hypothetical protein